MIEEFLFHHLLGGRGAFFLRWGIWGWTNSMIFQGVEREPFDVWSCQIFNVSLWASMTSSFCNCSLVLILLDWRHSFLGCSLLFVYLFVFLYPFIFLMNVGLLSKENLVQVPSIIHTFQYYPTRHFIQIQSVHKLPSWTIRFQSAGLLHFFFLI